MRKAAGMVFKGSKKPFEYSEFSIRDLKQGEILVEIEYSTICKSDVHTVKGKRKASTPLILGHEMLGRIIEMKPESRTDINGEQLGINHRITWSIAANCGKCYYCINNLPQKCENLFKYGHRKIDGINDLSGGYGTHCILVKGTKIVKIPDEMPDKVACPANCATATVTAAIRNCGAIEDKSVLIQGAGMLGITACAMINEKKARDIIIIDPNNHKLETAKRFGATYVINSREKAGTIKEQILKICQGKGVDLAFEMSGKRKSILMGLELLGIGGKYVMVGVVFPQKPVPIFSEQIVKKMHQIIGIHNYTPDDLTEAIDFLKNNMQKYPFGELISNKEFYLQNLNEAFSEAIKSKSFRIAVNYKL